MRDMESEASRDWLSARSDERDDAIETGAVGGAADNMLEGVAGGGGGFSPVYRPTPPTSMSPAEWLSELRFDASGRTVSSGGTSYTVERLAKTDRGWARFAADELVGASSEADKNNRACALAYANPDDVSQPYALIKEIRNPGAIASGNLKVLAKHVLELPQ